MDPFDDFDEFGNPIASRAPAGYQRDHADNGFGEEMEFEIGGVHEGDAAPPPLGDDDQPFGADVEILVETKPSESIKKPLVAPVIPKGDAPLLLETRKATEAADFLSLVLQTPSRRRNIAVVGHLHHGKTSLVQGIFKGTINQRKDEIDRCISVKANVVSGLVRGKQRQATMLLTLVDTPGHPDFLDEVAASLRLVDSAILCVDAAEGFHAHTERLVKLIVAERLPIVLVITKIDRLVLDLRLPPGDAYEKMKVIVDTTNKVIGSCNSTFTPPVHPQTGSVLFSSEKLGAFFSLPTFARDQYSGHNDGFDPELFAKRLWGPLSFERPKFVKQGPGMKSSFTTLVMEPFYKVLTHSIAGKGPEVISPTLSRTPLSGLSAMKEAVRGVFGPHDEIAVDCIVARTPTSEERDLVLRQMYSGVGDGEAFAGVAPLLRPHGNDLVAVTRIFKGTLKQGQKVEVINSAMSSVESTVHSIVTRTTTGLLKLPEAPSGTIVLLPGATANAVEKHAVLLPSTLSDREPPKIAALNIPTPLVRVSLEPVAPANTPTLRTALSTISKTFPGIRYIAEENGEFVLVGYGELYYDVVFHDLRAVHCKAFNIRLSRPYVAFQETVSEANGMLVTVPPEAPKDMPQISMTANLLEDSIVQEIESGNIRGAGPQTEKLLREQYKWDIVRCRGVWAAHGANILIDDTIANNVPKEWQRCIIDGFRAAVAKGPLCDEPLRGVRFMVTNVGGINSPNAKTGTTLAAVVSAAKKACHEAMVGANPRLMEPVLKLDVTAPVTQLDVITAVLAPRRGTVIKEIKTQGTQLCILKALLPVMDSFGFESELRVKTCGEAFPVAAFDHWSVVPGDPYDAGVKLPPLGVARGYELARDFTIKTRRRKGLPDELQ